ncbi:MAG: hypothetical protein GX444_07070 [Myxococcales bacterium]|nr:hypothetical protein [Myxococcales bacterium]
MIRSTGTKKILAVVLAAGFLIIGLNLLAAYALGKYYTTGFLLSSDFVTTAGPEPIYTWQPNLKHRFNAAFNVTLTTNAAGYRTHPFTSPDGKRRLVLLGDSISFGVFLPEEENLAGQIEKISGARGAAIEVFNLGIPTYNLRQYAESYRRYGKDLQPDTVVLQTEPGDFRDPPTLVLRPWIRKIPLLTWLLLRYHRSRPFVDTSAAGLATYREIVEDCAKRNARLIVVYFPYLIPNPFNNEWRQDKERFESHGAPVVDVASLLATVNPDLTAFRVRPEDPIHPDARAIALVADRLVTMLAEN